MQAATSPSYSQQDDDHPHQLTQLFLDSLHLRNDPYTAESSERAHDESVEPTVTYQNGDNYTWIDHILTRGSVYYRSHMVTGHTAAHLIDISDHLPLIADYYIDSDTTHLTDDNNPGLNQQATLANKHYHIDSKSKSKLQQSIYANFMSRITELTDVFPKNPEDWTPTAHDHQSDRILKCIFECAKAAYNDELPRITKYSKLHWSPPAVLLHHYARCLKLAKRLINPDRHHRPHHKDTKQCYSDKELLQEAKRTLTCFYNTHYNRTREDGSYTYRNAMAGFFGVHSTEDITPLAYLTADSTSRQEMLDLIATETRRTNKLLHAHNKHRLRKRISKNVARQEQRYEEGHLGSTVKWLLERAPRAGFRTTVDANGTIITDEVEQHKITIHHFAENHFYHPNSYLEATGLDQSPSPNSLTQLLHKALLGGFWRQDHEDHLLQTLAADATPDVQSLLDELQHKPTQDIRNEIAKALAAPITLADFKASLLSSAPKTAPGPSGITISMLKSIPEELLETLFHHYNAMWEAKYVPASWRKRVMAMIPKHDNAPTIQDMRPIMLLEVIRKAWLSIISDRQEAIMRAHNIFDPSQKGGLPRHGTEDAIMAVKNVIEDAHARGQELHIIGFDKQKAFDSPSRWLACLAWQRLGTPEHIAKYIAECDEGNIIFPKTQHFVLHPDLADSFTARSGVPQGDSISCKTYLAIEDIILSYLRKHHQQADVYYYQDPAHILRSQQPVQFVDDTYVFSRSAHGAQRYIDLLQVAGTVLNIHLNPKKTRHIHISWTANLTLINKPSPSLTVKDRQGGRHIIHPVPMNNKTRILGAYISGDMHDADLVKETHRKAQLITKTMDRKKASSPAAVAVIYKAVLPHLNYPLQFANTSLSEINKAHGPIRQFIKRKLKLHHFPDAVVFNAGATNYGFDYKNPTDTTMQARHAIMLRAQAGDPEMGIIMSTMMHRAAEQNFMDVYPTNTSLQLSVNGKPTRQQGITKVATWGAPLLEYFAAANHTFHFVSPRPRSTLHEGQSYTPLVDHFRSQSDKYPELKDSDVIDLYYNYGLGYAEELFPYNPDNQPSNTHLTLLLPILPTHLHRFITDTVDHFAQCSDISHGVVTLRPQMLLQVTDRTAADPSEISEFDSISLTPDGHVELQTSPWKLGTETYARHRLPTLSRGATYINNHREAGTDVTRYTDIREAKELTTSRYIANRGLDLQTSNQGLPRLFAYHIHQKIIIPSPAELDHHMTPFPLRFRYPPEMQADWEALPADQEAIIYTDGSTDGRTPMHVKHTPAHPIQTLGSAIVFSPSPRTTPWSERTIHILRITHTSPFGSSYSQELLPATAAAHLHDSSNGPTHSTTITDCQSLCVQTHKHLDTFFHSQCYDDQPFAATVTLPREGSEEGILYTALLARSHRNTLQHIKSHPERTKGTDYHTYTEHEMGNFICDHATRGETLTIRNALGPSAKIIHHTLTLPEFWRMQNAKKIPYFTTLAAQENLILFQQDTSAVLRISKVLSINNYLDQRHSTKHEGYQEWHNRHWHLAGHTIQSLHANRMTPAERDEEKRTAASENRRPSYKRTHNGFHYRFAMQLLYDKLTDDKFKRKISTPNDTLVQPPIEAHPTQCPLPDCHHPHGSIDHLLHDCSSPKIVQIRNTLLGNLRKMTWNTSLTPHAATLLRNWTTLLTQRIATNTPDPDTDSRTWAGLFAPHYIITEDDYGTTIADPTLTSTHRIFVEQTAWAAHAMWLEYCQATHPKLNAQQRRSATPTNATSPFFREEDTEGHDPIAAQLSTTTAPTYNTISRSGQIIVTEGHAPTRIEMHPAPRSTMQPSLQKGTQLTMTQFYALQRKNNLPSTSNLPNTPPVPSRESLPAAQQTPTFQSFRPSETPAQPALAHTNRFAALAEADIDTRDTIAAIRHQYQHLEPNLLRPLNPYDPTEFAEEELHAPPPTA